jgi:DNA-binding NarL/FixJ family response regulator
LRDAIAFALARTTELSPSPAGTGPDAAPSVMGQADRGGARAMPLTRREQEVARLVARGLTNRQIADDLVITEGTAINHLTHILTKLGFRSRAQVAAWAVEERLRGADDGVEM